MSWSNFLDFPNLARSDRFYATIWTALFGQIRISFRIVAAHFSDSVKWLPIWIGTAAAVTWNSTTVNANVCIVKVGQLVSPVQPDSVVIASIRPNLTKFHSVVSVTHAKVSFFRDSVSGTRNRTILLQIPSVFFSVRINDVSIIHFDTLWHLANSRHKLSIPSCAGPCPPAILESPGKQWHP